MRAVARLIVAAPAMLALLVGGAALCGASDAVKHVWVQVAPPHVGIVRALTVAPTCPEVRFDRRAVLMSERAAPDSDFDIRVCEATVPPGTRRIDVAGKRLRPPPISPRRIAVVGDTGCRLKAGDSLDDGFQACQDPGDWEFAKVAAQVAAWGPDLIIQVGDYLYREQACPDKTPGCAGSPFNSPGMRFATWDADYFTPAAPLLAAAPVVFVRGDHEQCERAGGGFFRFLDPFLRYCMDFSDPYALDFAGLRLVVMDTVQAGDIAPSPQVVVERYRQDFERVRQLAREQTWLVSHRPIWAVRPTVADGSKVEALNVTVQQALSGPLPPAIDLVLSGHIHLAEVLSFAGPRPPQVVVGTGGTKLLPEVSTDIVGKEEIDGEVVTDATIISTHGFVTFQPRRPHDWTMTLWDASGSERAVCQLAEKSAACTTD